MKSKGRLSTNLVTNVLSFSLNIMVGVFFTPYLIRHLGVSGYGFIPLASNLSSYLTIAALVINASVARYITVAIERDQHEEASQYFSTSFFGSAGLALLMVFPGALLVAFPDLVIRVPDGYGNEVRWLLTLTVGTILISFVTTPFEVATFCRNRFDIRSGIATASLFLRVALVIVCFKFSAPRLFHVGLGLILAALFSLLASIAAWRKLTPGLSLRLSQVRFHCLRQLANSGGWISVNQVGTLLLINIDLLVVNWYFGAESGGRYASLVQWSILLRGLALTVTGLLSPPIMYLYARNDLAGLVSYSRNALKYLGLFIALPVGLISGLAKPILSVWLGPDFVALAPLLTVMVAPLCINLGYIPLHNISMATNNVKVPGIVQVIAGVVNLLLAIFFVKFLQLGLYGVAAAGILVLTLRNVVFTPVYAARIIGVPYRTFMRELLPISCATALLGIFCWYLAHWLGVDSLPSLLTLVVVISFGYLLSLWLFVLSSVEKEYMLTLLRPNRSFA
ncbi:putative membrane protein EpsK [Geomonas silvestris]|uniref:Putative membrane protein EpsK n=1 Tax=Geomonas silvestris TaxID=2740184 RepID=A0A6V8MKR6_9BACT|nr:hypothetical protein [Geomonas silvestris]GFO60323.1 putative membrane protein EpsK [Geomonas silvestris]